MGHRRLILMRHATAATGANLATDHERPLTGRGTEEARAVGLALRAAGWVPDRVLYSDAARTTETWWCMSELLGEPPASAMPSLYGAGTEALAATVQRLAPSEQTVLVLGHNPGWSDAIAWLTGIQVNLAPANAALLLGRGERWAGALGLGALELEDVLRP